MTLALSTASVLAAEAETGGFELPFPAVFFGVIIFVVFMALLVVLWSYHDVANRHARKVVAAAQGLDGHDVAHGTASENVSQGTEAHGGA